MTVTVTQTPTTTSFKPPASPTPTRVHDVWPFMFDFATGGGNSVTLYHVQGYHGIVDGTCDRSDSECNYNETNAGSDFYLSTDDMLVFGDTWSYKASVTSYIGLFKGAKIGALTCETLPGATCYRSAARSSNCGGGAQTEEMYSE